jgi:hydrogenase nickel incorporation protein HypA/HybF
MRIVEINGFNARCEARGIERNASLFLLQHVEPSLLQSAFEIARAGTVASEAELEIEEGPIVVKCQECGARSAAQANRLLCQYCGEWRVNVVEGEELLLLSVEIETAKSESEESQHV